MKVSSIFLLISLFALMESSLNTFSTKKCSDYDVLFNKTRENYLEYQAFSRGFCRSLQLDEGYAQCCYLKYKYTDGNTYYNCAQLTLAQYYDIDKAKDYYKGLNYDVKSLECTSSSYLYGSFLLLLFILF